MASVARKDAKRFSSLNLGTTYKGAKPEQKGAGNKGGFQSLGKIQGKRMPGPAQLPSLRKENAGNDPNVNLVPQAGGGWGAGKEDEMENKELSNQPSTSQQPVTQIQEIQQPVVQQSTSAKETGVKKEGTIWATPEGSVGPASIPPATQQFKKNFPSLEEREARGTKRTMTNELHHDTGPVPFNEMDNMSNVMPPGHYYGHRPRPPYPPGPSHMAQHYIPRSVPPFRHGMPAPNTAEYNHYSHHGGSFRGYPPQPQPGLPPNTAAGGQYQYPITRYPLHPNSSLAHNMDPYDGQSKLVKTEELKNLELPDEDDDVGGWAGYHEEVDYSKKVVFDDSGDDEERESHQELQRQSKRKEIRERELTNRETRMQEAPPHTTLEQPRPHAEHSSKHLHSAPVDLQYFQQQQVHVPTTGGHYPLYCAHPQRGYPITVASRPVDRERSHPAPPQSDPQPIWNRRHKGVPPLDTAWGEDKLVTAPVSQSSAGQTNEQMESLQQQLEQTALSDSDPAVTATAEKKHVTFHLDQQQQSASNPATRQPLKIMMRDMKVTGRDEHEQPPVADIFHHSNAGKPPYLQRPSDTDQQHVPSVDKSLAQQQQRISPWKAADRGPITTPRTLYEPEGDKSAKKFNALIKQTSSERAKRSSVSDSTQDGEQLQSPSGDIKILKAEEKQSSKGKQQTTPTTPDDTSIAHNKLQQTSGSKSKNTEASSTNKRGSRKERPSFRQYQPPPARDQDEQGYSESKGSGRRSLRQDNSEQQGDSRGQRRRDRQQPEGKYHSDRRYFSDSKYQTEGKPQSEGKSYSEGRRQYDDGNRKENKSRREREASKEPLLPSHESTDQFTATAATDASKDDASKPEHSQDEKGKQSGKDTHSKGANNSGEAKHKKKSSVSGGGGTHKSDGSVSREKSRSRGGRNRNNDDWYYSEEYYNHWYATAGYDYYYDYYDDYGYYSDRRAPSGRQKQQQQQSYDNAASGKNTSERRDYSGKRSQQQSERGSNRPARTRGDRKDDPVDEKGQQHRTTTTAATAKDKSREVASEELPRSKPAEEPDTRERRRRDNKQYSDNNVDKKRSSRTSSVKGNIPQSSTTNASKSSASHDPSSRGQSRTSNNKTSVGQDRPPQTEDQPHTATTNDTSSSKKEPAIKDKAASAKMANVDINSPTVYVIDEEQTVSLSSAATESDDFIRVTSKKEKREMKELEKHRQQEKQRKAEEVENKKKHHSTRKPSQKTKHQQQHQLQEQPLPHEDQSLSGWSTTSTTTAGVSTAAVWTESLHNLLNEGVSQTTYMAAAHSSLISPGDYQLFPTSYSTSNVPLAHLSAAVDSSVAHDLPTTASQGHNLSETDVKPTGVGRPDTSSAGHGNIRTDLPLSKSHSSASVGGAIGRGRGSSSSRAPGSNRGSSSKDSSKKLPGSSSDSKISSTSSPKISKPSSAVRSKPSTLSSSDKVTKSSTTATMLTTVTATPAAGKKMSTRASVSRPATQDGSKRVGGHSAGGSVKSKERHSSKPSSVQRQPVQQPSYQVSSQPHPVSALSSTTSVSYAGAVKSSPSLQDKKLSTVNKPVAYVKPTAANTVTASRSLPDQQQEDIATVATSVEPLPRMPSFPTAHLSQELMAENDNDAASVGDQPKVKVATEPIVPPSSYVSPMVTKSSIITKSPIVTKSSSPGTAVPSSHLSSFVPFTFVASPSSSNAISNHQAGVVTKVTTVTTTITAHSDRSASGEGSKEGVSEVEGVASKRRRLSPVVTTQPSLTDHATKLNIAADPFIPSLPTSAHHHKSAVASINVTTPTIAATPTHKPPLPAACYQLPPMMHNMVPMIVPHPQMGSGYPISQHAATYPPVFPAAVPSHAYQMGTHPPPIVGLTYAGYPMQQPTMLAAPTAAVSTNNVPNPGVAGYNMFVPVSASSVLPAAPAPPAAVVHHAMMEQRKKEEQMKALKDSRQFEQNGAVANHQPSQLYKVPPVKQQLPLTTEGGRRTLLENPRVAMAIPRPPMHSMMNRPLEMTTVNNNSPSTGSKRKRRPPLMPLPPAANNVTVATLWDKPTNALY